MALHFVPAGGPSVVRNSASRPASVRLATARLATAVALGAVSFAALSACDNNATITPNPLLYKEAQIVGAYPARQVGGEWERVCGAGEPDGFLLNVAFLSFGRDENASDPGATDRDRSVRPGDVVNALVVEGGNKEDINFTSIGNVGVTLDCIDPVPDADNLASLVGHSCQGSAGTADLSDAAYLEFGKQRRDGHNVMILVDESGSIKGLVSDGDFIEGAAGDISVTSDFQQVASDYNQIRRTTVTRLLSTLNAEDRVGILAFGEGVAPSGRLKVPCTEASGVIEEDLDACFGTNRDLWNLSSLTTNQGRSNLWEATGAAWDYLLDRDDRTRTNHIIVITDGPDTCAQGEMVANCQTPCNQDGYHTVFERIEANEGDPNALPIHLHFVQFESKGYRDRDARQVEAACLTEGHYQFINNVDMATLSPASFEESLNTAVDNVRFSLMGFWQFAVESFGYANDSAPPNGSLRGSLYGLSGTMTLTQHTNLVSQDKIYPFGIGEGAQASQATNWDRRPTLRKPCTGPSDCAGAPASSETECHVVCSAETMTCPAGAQGIDLPSSAECTSATGAASSCCPGAGCLTPGTPCAACTGN